MEKLLLEIIYNSGYEIEIKTKNVNEIVDQVEEVTGVRINFRPAVWYWENDQGYERQRKPKDTYFLSV